MEMEKIELASGTEIASPFESTLQRSQQMEGGMGAIAFAVLEMFRLGGMEQAEIKAIHQKMDHYFMNPTNEQCNAICKMVETRLKADRREDNKLWYQ